MDVTGLFPGRELSTEYLYGLFANFTPTPESFNLLGFPISENLIRFAGNQNIVSFSFIAQFHIAALDFTFPQEFAMWLTYNAAGEVSQYDISARRLDRSLDYVLNATMAAINTTSPVVLGQFLTGVLAKSVCSVAQTYCNGTNQQYTDEAQCLNFLTTQVRFGKAYELGANTLICRMVHQQMVPFRPGVHCPHIGPSGGNFCVDSQTYPEAVLEPVFTAAPYVPYGWQNPDPTIAAE